MYFINISNHPSNRWNEKQKEAAESMNFKKKRFILDIPFPNVNPTSDNIDIGILAQEVFEIITERTCLSFEETIQNCIFLVQGEFSLTFRIVTHILKKGGTCVTAASERKVIEEGNKKTSIFEFVKFREYQ